MAGDGPRHLLAGNHLEDIARSWHVGQAGDDGRRRRSGVLHLAAAVIEQGPHLAEDVTHHQVVTDMEGAALHQHGRNRATTLLEVRVDHGTGGELGGVGLEVLEVCDQQDHFEQLRDPGLLLGGDGHHDGLPAPILGNEALLGETLLDTVGVGALLIDLVDGDDDRDLRRLHVRNRLDRLRHDAVVGGYHQDSDVGHLGTAGAHGRERLVARGIQEDDAPSLLLDDVSADALGDATRLAHRDLGLPDGVEQRGLAMVDMAHHGDHRRTRLQVLRRFAVYAEELRAGGQLDLGAVAFANHLFRDGGIHRHRAGLNAKAVGHDGGGIEVDLLVDVRHHAVLH